MLISGHGRCGGSLPAWVLCGLLLWPVAQADARDIFFLDPTEAQCRACHEDLATFPQLVTTNANRHHRRLSRPVVGLGGGMHLSVAPGDAPTGVYTCMTCHGFTLDAAGAFSIAPYRNCLDCHPRASVVTSPGSQQNVHHFTATYYEGRCKACHESPLAIRNKRLGSACRDADECEFYDRDSDFKIEGFTGDFSLSGGGGEGR